MRLINTMPQGIMVMGCDQMFSKLKFRIVISIVLSTFLFCTLINVTTGIIIGNNYVRVYQDASIETVKIAIDFSEIKLETIENDSLRVLSNETLIAGLKKSTYDIAVKPKLNFFRSQYQEEIIGLTLYGTNGFVYITDVDPVYTIIPFTVLVSDTRIAHFISSEETSMRIWMQDANSPELIDNLALIFKIIDDEVLLGYLFININPEYLHNEYFDYSSFEQFDLVQNYILDEESIMDLSPIHANGTYKALLRDEMNATAYFQSRNHFYIIHEPLYGTQATLVTITDTSPLRLKIVELIMILITIDTIMVGGAFIIARKQADFICERLTKLKDNMQKAPDLLD